MELALNFQTLKPLVKGLLTWIPGVHRAFYNATAPGGTASADYCYGVWLKHMMMLFKHGMPAMPRTVVELGPGGTLGTGVAALLSGAERYAAVDQVRHATPAATVAVLHELAKLFQARAPRPKRGWPDYDDALDANLFPSAVLTPERLERSLAPERLHALAAAASTLDAPHPDSLIRYATWADTVPVRDREADLVFSHVVLCHVEDLDAMYANFARWLKPGGWMSHQVEFSALGTAEGWNGHLAYGETTWKLIAGRRPYFVSREPASTHLELMQKHGFEVKLFLRAMRDDGLPREKLAPRWRGLSDEDLTTWNVFVVARKARP